MNEGMRQVRQKVKPAMDSKLEEFELLGYGHIQEKEIWDYLEKKRWKSEKEKKLLHQVVNDILTLKPGDIINFMAMESYKNASYQKENFREQWKDLLK
ncbi:post-transcriptional regulator [Bacillus songklensis]|uniref:Post-transcriptional regulator n=1 Tax=Bacillus songklensis TaxID=1069116 RepID=A0ABV8AZQ5_9BACI